LTDFCAKNWRISSLNSECLRDDRSPDMSASPPEKGIFRFLIDRTWVRSIPSKKLTGLHSLCLDLHQIIVAYLTPVGPQLARRARLGMDMGRPNRNAPSTFSSTAAKIILKIDTTG